MKFNKEEMISEEEKTSDSIVKTFSKSECQISDEYDSYLYSLKSNYFVDNQVEIKGNDVTINYRLNGLVALSMIKMDELDRIRLLIDIAKFNTITNQFLIDLAPDNIYVDYNFHGFLLDHFLCDDESDFLNKYKALCASLYLNQYTYNDIYEGGLSLLDESDFLISIKNSKDVEEVVKCLSDHFNNIQSRQGEIVEVPLVIHKRKKIITVILCFVLVISLGFNVYNHFFIISKLQIEQNATKFYLENRYSDTIQELDNVETDDLEDNCLFMLAVSYIQTSSLNEKSKTNALSQVDANGNNKYSYYWVALGRGDFEEAYQIADSFEDERLKYFGYSVELNSLKTNTDLSNDEKDKRKEELEKKLNSYIESIKKDSD